MARTLFAVLFSIAASACSPGALNPTAPSTIEAPIARVTPVVPEPTLEAPPAAALRVDVQVQTYSDVWLDGHHNDPTHVAAVLNITTSGAALGSYTQTIDYGDGTDQAPWPTSSTTAHSYPTQGSWVVTVRARDQWGRQAVGTTVVQLPQPCVVYPVSGCRGGL